MISLIKKTPGFTHPSKLFGVIPLGERGFTLIELIIAMAIIVIVVGVLVSPFATFRRNQILKAEAENILSLINKARSQTLAAKNDLNYGVHFSTTSTILFPGNTYDPSHVANEIITLNEAVSIETIDLSGGTNEVVFNRLIGTVSATGTITVSLVSDQTKSKQIIIKATGLVSTD